jgi:hypothetical protein
LYLEVGSKNWGMQQTFTAEAPAPGERLLRTPFNRPLVPRRFQGVHDSDSQLTPLAPADKSNSTTRLFASRFSGDNA